MGSHLFPLTPALSLGEGENRPPLRGESNSLSRAGVSALNRGAHGACVAEFIGSWQAHWCFERGFPLTPALSIGGRIVCRAFGNRENIDSSQRGVRCSLSLRERARVRGNETQPTQTGRES